MARSWNPAFRRASSGNEPISSLEVPIQLIGLSSHMKIIPYLALIDRFDRSDVLPSIEKSTNLPSIRSVTLIPASQF
jgi:hypothetical protein